MTDNNSFKTYRITEDVKEELLRALIFHRNHNLTKNELLTERAFNDLQNHYEIINFNYNSSEPVITKSSATKSINEINFENSLSAFESDINFALENINTKNFKKILEDIKEKFSEIIKLK
jgi:hypothetical protein